MVFVKFFDDIYWNMAYMSHFLWLNAAFDETDTGVIGQFGG